MSISKEANKMSKTYIKTIKVNLTRNLKKNGKIKVITQAFYHGYLTALNDLKKLGGA